MFMCTTTVSLLHNVNVCGYSKEREGRRMSGEIMSLGLSLAGTAVVVAVLVLPHLYGRRAVQKEGRNSSPA